MVEATQRRPLIREASRTNGSSIGKSLLKQQAYVQLKELIQNVTFGPGDFLSERQLALRLGMSKTPVKAALERLEAEGFIAVSPQQGIVVRDLSVHEVADQFEIRVALETFVARSLAGRINADQTKQLRENLKAQKAAVEKHNVARCVELDTDFHMLLCRFHSNLEILRVMSQLRDRIHRAISRVLVQSDERLNNSYSEHFAIVDALVANDPDLAARRIEEHLDYGKEFLLSPRRR